MSNRTLDEHLSTLRKRWDEYRSDGGFEAFVEFTLELNGLAEYLARLRLPGLVRQCEELENAALALFGDPDTHPIAEQSIGALNRQIEGLLGSILTARRPDSGVSPGAGTTTGNRSVEWVKPRSIWMVAPTDSAWAAGLAEQLAYYGFRVRQTRWGGAMPDGEPPFAVLFLPDTDGDGSESVRRVSLEQVSRMRARCPASQLIYIGVPRTLDTMVTLMRAGIDFTVQRDDRMAALLSRILDLVQTREQERYRVLIVEDSRVAVAQIQRALEQRGIHSHAISDPTRMFEVLDDYRPDLVLMDMYMPTCNGVEATRALRQLPAYQAIPIIYLSGETDVGLQVEALRLGGDQFLTKPFNPVLLSATVKTTVERHREMQRASRHDGLTGLLNHTAAKSDLDLRLRALPPDGRMCVAMIDIDNFKLVNDTYGHPVGDQVIRSLAWLLKGRLRGTDLIGRYGGEEFIVATADVGLNKSYAVLDHIRSQFANLPHAHTEGILRVTFSAGVAAYPDFENGRDLIEAADNALLEAKRLGRNRVETAPPPFVD
jgi:diguanylate cyclase (GGDEF)-like protein